MGAALLREPDRLESILCSLVENVPLPITCKIRLIPGKIEDGEYIRNTIAFAKRMEKCGIAALGVHCRFSWQKPREKGYWEIFEHLHRELKIPILANGDFYSRADIYEIQKIVPLNSFLIARGAQWNPSVFRKEGPLSIYEVMKEFIELAKEFNMPFHSTKYVVAQYDLGKDHKEFTPRILASKSFETLEKTIWEIANEFKQKNLRQATRESLSGEKHHKAIREEIAD